MGTGVYHSADEMWYAALDHLLRKGKRTGSRDGDCLEQIGYSAKLAAPIDNWVWNPRRKASATYGAAELLWYLSGTSKGEQMVHYAKQYGRFLEADGTANGAYGARWSAHDQVKTVFDVLTRSPSSRQAIMTCWEPKDLATAVQGTSKDLPCTCTLQFLLRDRHLYLSVYMRSNDVWLGMPYDMWCFSSLQRLLAAALGVDLGWYMHTVGSLHLYQRNADAAADVSEYAPTDADWRLPAGEYDDWQQLHDAMRSAFVVEQVSRTAPDVFQAWDAQMPSLLEECAALCAVHNTKLSAPTWLNKNLLR